MPFQDTVISATKIHDHSDNALGGKLVAGDTSYDLSSGSILYSNGSVQLELGIGSENDVLTISSSLPSWVAPASAFSMPAGALIQWCGLYNAIPSGWLLCDGSEISRTTYADLFAAVGTQFGSTGGGTFTLPLFQSIFPRSPAASTSCGATGGADSITLSTAQMPTHSHTITDSGHVHSKVNGSAGSSGEIGYDNTDVITTDAAWKDWTSPSATTGITINNTGSSNSFDNKPSYLEVLFIIKT